LAVTLAFAVGCGSKEAPPQAVAPAKPQAAPAPATAAVQVTEDAKPKYRYDPYNKPDPFESFMLTDKSGVNSMNPMQDRDISEFKLKGIIWNIKTPYALMEDPTGKGYMIKIGSKIGRNNGELISISKCEVVVLEKMTDLSKRIIKTNKVSIKLPECR
jgi:type IV pilus assembly protein PilP